MAISARQTTTNTILISFGSPITQTGINAAYFSLSTGVIQSLLWGHDEVTLTTVDPITEPEVWCNYTATVGGAQIIRTVGAMEPVLSFEVLVLGLGLSGNDPQTYSVLSTEYRPTLSDYIEAFTLEEAIAATNPADSSATQPDELKFLRAVEDAEALWNSEAYAINAAGLVALNPGKRRSLLAITRYMLESFCPRPHVLAAYNEVLKTLRAVSSSTTAPGDQYIGDDGDFFYFSNTDCDLNHNTSCGCTL
jgi:hypothetical protein